MLRWRDLRESIPEHIYLSFKHWRTLCLGGVVAAISVVQAIVPDLNVGLPYWAWILIGLIAVPVAQFLAFQEVREQRDHARKELGEMAAKASSVRPQIATGPVMSIGQKGGQTVGLIQNIMGQQARKLPSDLSETTSKLAEFAGTELTVVFLASDLESKRLADGIYDLLKHSGWKPSEPRATIFGGAPEGVIVVGPGNTIPEFNPALLALGEYLKSVGIHTVAQTGENLEIIVGCNPD